MSYLIQSLRRLFVSGSIEKAKVDDMLTKGTINQVEHDYILTGVDGSDL